MTSQTFGSWTYLYNAGNERIGKQAQALGWTFTLRDPGERVSTEFAGSTPSRDNVFLGNLLVASYANTAVGGNSSPWSFYSSDHLGTPRLVTHIDVADSESHKYWPYGDEVTVQTAPQRLRFAAMEADPESSRFYDHARHHDFGLARFIGPDKLSGHLNDAQSWNRYAYARNNPLRYIDPNGQDGVEAAKWVRAQAQAVADWGGTHDGAHYSSYANVANTMSTVADWLESGSSTGDAIGSGADFHDLGMAFATDLGRVSSFMFSAATAVEGVLGDMGAKRSPTIQENKAKGDAFRDSVAADLRAQKREVATEQAKSTPFGTRVIDVEVRQNGKPLGGIETKTGASPYTPAQRAKDEYLRRVGYPVTVVRDN